jgi:hypothetical protein
VACGSECGASEFSAANERGKPDIEADIREETMAITDIAVFARLTDGDIENMAVELDAIRLDIEDSRGERDARYIRVGTDLTQVGSHLARATRYA